MLHRKWNIKGCFRFRFSLGAIFATLTVFCVWLGGEMNRIHKRSEATEELLSRGMTVSEMIDAGVFTRKALIPAYRRWLGDAPVGEIHATGKFNIDEKNRLQYLFPEADIIEWGDFDGSE